MWSGTELELFNTDTVEDLAKSSEMSMNLLFNLEDKSNLCATSLHQVCEDVLARAASNIVSSSHVFRTVKLLTNTYKQQDRALQITSWSYQHDCVSLSARSCSCPLPQRNRLIGNRARWQAHAHGPLINIQWSSTERAWCVSERYKCVQFLLTSEIHSRRGFVRSWPGCFHLYVHP